MIESVGGPRRRIVQAAPEYSFCAGCDTCEIVCSLTHDGLVGPCYNRIFIERDTRRMYHTIHACQHCADHPCFEACPKKGEAMAINGDGVVFVVEENCIGCGMCRRACAFDPPRINIVRSADRKLRKAKKCDLCAGREEGPACVQWCPVRCISVVGDEESAGSVVRAGDALGAGDAVPAGDALGAGSVVAGL